MVISLPYKDPSQRYFFLFNIVTFKGVWAAGVLGQGSMTLVGLLLLALHFILSPSRLRDVKVMAMIASIGVAIDLLLTLSGVFVFSGVLFPFWLVMIWFAFALVFNHSCAWLHKVPWMAQCLIGAFGGGCSYYFGARLGAVEFAYPTATSVAIIAAVWSVAFPLFCYIARRVRDEEESPR